MKTITFRIVSTPLLAALLAAAPIALTAVPANARVDLAVKCEGGKKVAAAKYLDCRTKALQTLVASGRMDTFATTSAKCDSRFSQRWGKLEATALEDGASCLSNGDAQQMAKSVLQCTHLIDWLAAPAQPEPVRAIDNGDGTITDKKTGLMWERHISSNGSLHGPYFMPWSGFCSVNTAKRCQPTTLAALNCATQAESDTDGCSLCGAGDGTCDQSETNWTWLVSLNTAAFAGHTDWRLPTRSEMESLVDPGNPDGKIIDGFSGSMCGPTCTDVTNPDCACAFQGSFSTATTLDEKFVYVFNFSFGEVSFVRKSYDQDHASQSIPRAVRFGD